VLLVYCLSVINMVMVEVTFHYSAFIPFIVFCSSEDSCLLEYDTVRIEQVVLDILEGCSAFRMSGNVHQMPWHHVAHSWNLQQHCCENLKS
jgi:hypothetical protein